MSVKSRAYDIIFITIGRCLYCLTFSDRKLHLLCKHFVEDSIQTFSVVSREIDENPTFILSFGICTSEVKLYEFDCTLPEQLTLLYTLECDVTELTSRISLNIKRLILVANERSSDLARVWVIPTTAPIMSHESLYLSQGVVVNSVDTTFHVDETCYVVTAGDNRINLWNIHFTLDNPECEFMLSCPPHRKGVQSVKFVSVGIKFTPLTILVAVASRDRSVQIINLVKGEVVRNITELGNIHHLVVLNHLSSHSNPSFRLGLISFDRSICAHSVQLDSSEIICSNLYTSPRNIMRTNKVKFTLTVPLAIHIQNGKRVVKSVTTDQYCLEPESCSIMNPCSSCSACCCSDTNLCTRCSNNSVTFCQFIVAYNSHECDTREIFFYTISPLVFVPKWRGYLVGLSNSTYQFYAGEKAEETLNKLRVQCISSFFLRDLSYLALSFEERVRANKRTKIIFTELNDLGPGRVQVLWNPNSSTPFSCPEVIPKMSVTCFHDQVILSTINDANGTLTCFICDTNLKTSSVIEIRDSQKILNDIHLAEVRDSYPLMISCRDDNLIRVYENYLPVPQEKNLQNCCPQPVPKILQGHKDDVTCVTSLLVPGNKYPYIISGSSDTSVRIWAYPLGTLIRVLDGHKMEITSVAATSYQDNLTPIIISGSCDKTIRIWSFNTGEEFRRLEMPHDRPSAAGDINTVAVCIPNIGSQNMLIGSNDSGTITVWDMTMMVRGLAPFPDDILFDFLRDCKGYRAQGQSLSEWPRMSELFLKFSYAEVLFLNNRLFSLAVLLEKPSFVKDFLVFSSEAIINCNWEEYSKQYCSVTEYNHINERSSVFAEYWTDFVTKDQEIEDSLSSDGLIIHRPFKNQSLLYFSMACQNKAAVEVVADAMTTLFLIPPTDFPYSMYYHISRLISSSDIILLAKNYPFVFHSFICSLRPIQANHIVFDPTSDPRFYVEPDTSSIHTGVTYPSEDRGLWTKYAERKYASETKKEYLNVSAMMPMFIPLPSTATLSFLRSVLYVCDAIEDSSLFQAPVVHYSLRFIWKKVGINVHALLMQGYIIFVLVYSAACSQYETHYFGSHIDLSISIALHTLLIFLVLQLSIQEYIQFSSTHSIVEHFSDLWNIVDITNITVCVGGTAMRLLYQQETSLSRIFFAFGFITVYGRILYFLRAFKSVGPLVSMILRIGHHIRFFTLILLLELVAFAGAFRMMTFGESENSTYFSSFFACVLYMFGNGEMEYRSTASPLITRGLYILFLFTINILLLNLLIALMGDAYNSVAESTISEWRRQQCKLTFEHLGFTTRIMKLVKERPLFRNLPSFRHFLNRDHFPTTLHLLYRACDVMKTPSDIKGELNSSISIGHGRDADMQELKKRIRFLEEQIHNVVKLQTSEGSGRDGTLFQEDQVGDRRRSIRVNQIQDRNVDTDDDSDYED